MGAYYEQYLCTLSTWSQVLVVWQRATQHGQKKNLASAIVLEDFLKLPHICQRLMLSQRNKYA